MRFELLAGLLALTCVGACANATPREQEIAECRPGEIATWADGRDRPALGKPLVFVYWDSGAPTWFSSAQVMELLKRSSQAWAGCGIESRVSALLGNAPLPAGAVVVQWSEAGSRGNFGLANLGQRTLALSPAMFQLLRTRNPSYPAEQTLQMVVSHEMGHFFGLMAHSRRCIDVTSYYTDGKGGNCYARDRSQLKTVVEYRSILPTACDIQRCRIANGLPVNAP
ncbi:zinc metalloprotease [Roseateles oligotrophus]|uniref:Peptidase metallopeptidase domain-containing protein n=1 Tax=Roseateles oligotrophus TaxID=1769250 RepID=A0ABT2YCY2_9BURK|nr:hypothetical protein [Roseateles oligotrophus]MCV2367911.1 hypothetical protein [Roseateles oligotrophus]